MSCTKAEAVLAEDSLCGPSVIDCGPAGLVESGGVNDGSVFTCAEGDVSEPNRWMHLRHPHGFTEEQYKQFKAHVRVFEAYVRATLENWECLPVVGTHPSPEYEFFEPELSGDHMTVTLPLGGEQTLGSRATFEDGSSNLLWQHMPLDFLLDLEEGLTETTDRSHGPQTNWRRALRRR